MCYLKKKVVPKKIVSTQAIIISDYFFIFFYFEENLSYMRFDSQSFTKFTYGEKSFKINDNKIKSMQLCQLCNSLGLKFNYLAFKKKIQLSQ